MIKKYKILLTIGMLAPFLSGCVAQRQPITIQQRQQIQSNKTILNTTQTGIRLEENNVFNSNLPAGSDPMDSGYMVHKNDVDDPGVLEMVISDDIQDHEISNDKKIISPVRKKLGNFSFISCFQNDLNKNLKALPWLGLKKVTVQYNIKEGEKKIVTTSKENTVLFVGTTYALNSTFERLEVMAYVKLDQRLVQKNDIKKIYYNVFSYTYRLPNSNTKKTNRILWTQDHAALLKNQLRTASAILSKAIASDMNNPNAASSNTNNIVVQANTAG